MKKLLIPILMILIIASIVVVLIISLAKQKTMTVVYQGNINKVPIDIVLGAFEDGDCGMVIDTLEYAAQIISDDGKTWFFHDIGGIVNWLKNRNLNENNMTIWVMSKDSKKWIDGKKAWYSLTDTTPMNYGFGAYENRQNNFIDFSTMKLKMLRGENLNNPLIRKKLLNN